MSSDPENEDMNDSFKAVFTEAFKISNLPLSKIDVCDRRNENMLADFLYDYDVILLAGTFRRMGHACIDNKPKLPIII